jgi:hypothetical protein
MRKDSGKWMELCAHAVDEKDPKKFALLILEINSMLEAKERRLLKATAAGRCKLLHLDMPDGPTPQTSPERF